MSDLLKQNLKQWSYVKCSLWTQCFHGQVTHLLIGTGEHSPKPCGTMPVIALISELDNSSYSQSNFLLYKISFPRTPKHTSMPIDISNHWKPVFCPIKPLLTWLPKPKQISSNKHKHGEVHRMPQCSEFLFQAL